MKDRFTTLLVLLVAFVGGVSAMVFIARWQPGKSEASEAKPVAAAQAQVPASRGDGVDEAGAGRVAPAEEPAPQLERSRDRDGSGPDLDATEATAHADAASRRTSAESPGTPDEPGGTARIPRERTAAVPESNRPRDSPQSPASGSSGGSSQKAGRSDQSGATRGTADAPRAFFADPTESGARAAPRTPGTESPPAPVDPQRGTGSSPDATQDPPIEEAPGSEPDSQYDPKGRDESREPQEQEPEAEPEQEPEVPPALVVMTPAQPQFATGDSVPVMVDISSGTDVGHVPFYVKFDPRVLRFDRGEEGPFLGVDGVQTMFVATQSSAGDTVVVGLSRLGQSPGIDGAGRLCVLYFVAVGPGTSNLSFLRQKVKDSTNDTVPSHFLSTAVTVN